MPVYSKNGTPVPTPEIPGKPQVIDTASVLIPAQYRERIASYIEGSSWTVNYYNQHLGGDDVVAQHDDINDPTIKQYRLITGFELRVTEALSSNIDQSTKLATIRGSSNVYPVIVPQSGDTFVASVGDGYKAKFTVTNTERLTYFKGSAYRIDYTLDKWINDADIAELSTYVVDTLIFDRQGMTTSGNALLTESEWVRKLGREQLTAELINYYYDKFFNVRLGTFVAPFSGRRVYDDYIVRFWLRYVDMVGARNHESPRQWDIRNGIYTTPYTTVYDAFSSASPMAMTHCVQKMTIAGVGWFGSNFFLNNLFTSGFDGVILPIGGEPLAANLLDMPPNTVEENFGTHYVFNEAFYTGNKPGMSDIGNVVYEYIHGTSVFPFSSLRSIATTIMTLSPMEQFYQIPFVLALLRVSR